MVSIYNSAAFFICNLNKKEDLKSKLDSLQKILNKELWGFNELDKLRDGLFNQELEYTLDTIQNWRNKDRESFYKENILTIDSNEYFVKNSLIDIPQCDLDWPLCLYDRKYRFEVPLFTVFSCKNAPIVIDDFFFVDCGKETGKEFKYNDITDQMMNPIIKKVRIYSDLVIERRQHHCLSEKHFTNDLYRIINVDNKELCELKLEEQFKRTKLASVYFEDSNMLYNNKSDQTVWEVIEKKSENNRSEDLNSIPLSHSVYL